MITDREIDRYIQQYLSRKFDSRALQMRYFTKNDHLNIPCEYVTYTCSLWPSAMGVLWLVKSHTFEEGPTANASVWFENSGMTYDHTIIHEERIIFEFMETYFRDAPVIQMSPAEMTQYVDQYTDGRLLSVFVAHIIRDLAGIKNDPEFTQIIKQYIDDKIDEQLSSLGTGVIHLGAPYQLMSTVDRLVNICSRLADKT